MLMGLCSWVGVGCGVVDAGYGIVRLLWNDQTVVWAVNELITVCQVWHSIV